MGSWLLEKENVQGPRHQAERAGPDLLFHSTDACLVPCPVLTARDTGINGTAKTPPTLPRHALATFPGPPGVCPGALGEGTSGG